MFPIFMPIRSGGGGGNLPEGKGFGFWLLGLLVVGPILGAIFLSDDVGFLGEPDYVFGALLGAIIYLAASVVIGGIVIALANIFSDDSTS